MNVHHLELFYYVARHGGIMPAVRNIPYGIQQPAVSAQVAQLEEYLGATLFHRRPFALTPAGEKLYRFIQPFFANLDKMAEELQGGQARHIRIGASTIVLRDHVPDLLQGLRKKYPELKVTLREGYPDQLEKLLEHDEIDVAITLIEKQPPAGYTAEVMLELPLVLLVPKASRWKAAAELWAQDKITESLICLPPSEMVTGNFLKHLAKQEVEWFPGVEASSTDLIQTYVASGLGIGLSVAIPRQPWPANVRALSLPGFPPVTIGAFWRGRPTPLLQLFLTEARSRAKELA
ncbi:MAG TPA: LysR family transcriptional regulator [Dongiaceae bacterium]|nr:LysR family transcriptional regulator [Dongiaceae bacterium]